MASEDQKEITFHATYLKWLLHLGDDVLLLAYLKLPRIDANKDAIFKETIKILVLDPLLGKRAQEPMKKILTLGGTLDASILPSVAKTLEQPKGSKIFLEWVHFLKKQSPDLVTQTYPVQPFVLQEHLDNMEPTKPCALLKSDSFSLWDGAWQHAASEEKLREVLPKLEALGIRSARSQWSIFSPVSVMSSNPLAYLLAQSSLESFRALCPHVLSAYVQSGQQEIPSIFKSVEPVWLEDPPLRKSVIERIVGKSSGAAPKGVVIENVQPVGLLGALGIGESPPLEVEDHVGRSFLNKPFEEFMKKLQILHQQSHALGLSFPKKISSTDAKWLCELMVYASACAHKKWGWLSVEEGSALMGNITKMLQSLSEIPVGLDKLTHKTGVLEDVSKMGTQGATFASTVEQIVLNQVVAKPAAARSVLRM